MDDRLISITEFPYYWQGPINCHCLGLDHETMVCVVCLFIFLRHIYSIETTPWFARIIVFESPHPWRVVVLYNDKLRHWQDPAKSRVWNVFSWNTLVSRKVEHRNRRTSDEICGNPNNRSSILYHNYNNTWNCFRRCINSQTLFTFGDTGMLHNIIILATCENWATTNKWFAI